MVRGAAVGRADLFKRSDGHLDGQASRAWHSINGTMPGWAERVDDNPLLAFVDSCLRGIGQVCFMNNPVTGLAILVAMFVGEAWLGFAGALGLVVSTLSAIVIGMDRGAIRAGLFGFNGVLVGAGLSLFLQPDWDALVMVWIAVGAFFSTILHAALASVFIGAWKVPPFTLAFNFMTLIFLIGALNFANGRVGGLIAPGRRAGHRRLGLQHAALGRRRGVGEQHRGRPERDLPRHQPAVLRQQHRGGDHHRRRHRRVLADRGDLRARRLDRRHAHRAGARRERRGDLQRPLGVQLVRRRAGRRRRVLRAHAGGRACSRSRCAVLAALLFGAIASLFTPWGLPALTLPFFFATLAFVLLKGASTELEPVAVEDITTPEEHLARRAPRPDEVGRAAVPA